MNDDYSDNDLLQQDEDQDLFYDQVVGDDIDLMYVDFLLRQTLKK